MKAASNHEYGIDALRILTSFMVVVLHLLHYGGIQTHVQPFSFSYYSCFTLGIFFVCAVNCFGLISGYIGYSSKYKISNIISHHFTVLFYTLSITVVFRFVVPHQFRFSSFFTALSPVTSSTYWYYTSYFVLFMLMPAINAAVATLKKRQLDFLLLVLLILLSVIPCILGQDVFHTKYGYSAFWLSVLYFLGAYLKKYHTQYKKNTARHFAVYVFSILSACIVKFILEYLSYMHSSSTNDYSQIIEYTSPFILLSSISLLLMFSTFHFPHSANHTIRFFSRSSFSTYLLHEHPFIRDLFIREQFRYILQFPGLLHIPMLLISGMAIWVVCIAIDQLRIIIQKLFRTEKLLDYLESVFTSLRLYGQ